MKKVKLKSDTIATTDKQKQQLYDSLLKIVLDLQNLNSAASLIQQQGAGTYGSAANIPQIVVDSNGNITSITNIPIVIPAAYITSVLDTNTIDLGVALGVLTADVRTQNTTTINLSSDAAGLMAALASTNISQFANDSGYITSVPSQPDASDTVKGVTKLSVAAASPTSPISVGDNDSRVQNVEHTTNKTDTVAGNTTSSTKFLSVKGYYDWLLQGITQSLSSKTTPVDGDSILIEDSADGNKTKKSTWANIKATLKTYFDTLYVLSTNSHDDDYLQIGT